MELFFFIWMVVGNLVFIICFDVDFFDFVKQINLYENDDWCDVFVVSVNDWEEVEDIYFVMCLF